jgi:hypothetical protein
MILRRVAVPLLITAAPAATDPVAHGRPPVRLVIIIPAAPHAQKSRDEDGNDNGDEADHEQKHRTTQQAMAVWVAPARLTRPSRGPSPVSPAPRFHPRLHY